MLAIASSSCLLRSSSSITSPSDSNSRPSSTLTRFDPPSALAPGVASSASSSLISAPLCEAPGAWPRPAAASAFPPGAAAPGAGCARAAGC
eukprot:scaffold927_cov230-Pinguiococcus_pyrenoidosus.AAC.12